MNEEVIENTETTTGTPGQADTSTTDTTPAPAADKPLSLRDSLEANMEIAEKGEEAPDLSKAAKTLAAARKGKPSPGVKVEKVEAPKPDEAKRAAELAAMDPAARAAAEADDKKKVEDASSKALEAPTSWPAADREQFGKLPVEAKQFLLRRHKEMEDGFHKRSQEVAGRARELDELDDAFKHHKQQMDLSGISRTQAVRQLVAAHDYLLKDPHAAIKSLAGQYGVELKSLVEGAAAADPAGESPTVKALRAEVAELRSWREQSTQTQSQQQFNDRLTEVEHFAQEKDAQGNLKRPYFEEVTADVAREIRAAKAEGKPIALQDAYDRAVRANPVTFEKMLAARDAERRSKEEMERKAKAEAARKAGFNVSGEGAAAVAAGQSTLRESLEKAWDAGSGRV